MAANYADIGRVGKLEVGFLTSSYRSNFLKFAQYHET